MKYTPHNNINYMMNNPILQKACKKILMHTYFLIFFCSLVDRHRMVNEALSEELSQGLHALSIVAKTEEQWRKMVEDGRAAVEGSPQCRGGFGK